MKLVIGRISSVTLIWNFKVLHPRKWGFGDRAGKPDYHSMGTVIQSYLPPFRDLGSFVHLTLPVSLGRYTNSRQSILFYVYATETIKSHKGVGYIICSGLTNSRGEL